MRTASLLGLAAGLFAATPAFATATIHCTTGRGGPELYLSIGNTPSAIVQARLVDGGQELITGHDARSPKITQSWLDRHLLRLDMADANVEHFIARLDTRKGRGVSFDGTLSYRNRTWPVRCLWDEDE